MKLQRYKKAADGEAGLTLVYAIMWTALILGTIFIAGLNFALCQITLFLW